MLNALFDHLLCWPLAAVLEVLPLAMTGWLGWVRLAMAPHLLSASSLWCLAPVAAGLMLKALFGLMLKSFFDHLLCRPLAAVLEVLPLAMTGWLGWLRVAMAPHLLSADSHWFLAAVAAGVMLNALFDHLLCWPLAAVLEVLPLAMTGWLGWLRVAMAPHILSASPLWCLAPVAAGLMLKALLLAALVQVLLVVILQALASLGLFRSLLSPVVHQTV